METARKPAPENPARTVYKNLGDFMTKSNRGAPRHDRRIVIGKKNFGLTIQFQKVGVDQHGNFHISLTNGQAWNISATDIESCSTIKQMGVIEKVETHSLKQVLESLEINPPEGLPEEVRKDQRNLGDKIKKLLGF